jgi:hypothetical protein
MFSAMLLVISVVALLQFALYYWRAVLTGVAAQPVSDRVMAAACVEDGRLAPQHFDTFAGIYALTPELNPERKGLGFVRAYYRLVEALDTLCGAKIPAVAAWSVKERTICARYAAVQVDRRLQASLDLATSLRSC